MRQIRKNVFETNSSSSHSIVLVKENFMNDEDYFGVYLSERDNYIYTIWRDEDLSFGRYPFQVLDTFKTKLCYAIATYQKDRFAELNELAKKYMIDINSDDIIHCTGLKLPKCDWYSWEPDMGEFIDEHERDYYGDIDHQSMGLLDCVLEKEGITLEEFLIDPHWIIIIDGDEYDTYSDLKQSGLIRSESIKKEYGAC